jgi:hypothetical protein
MMTAQWSLAEDPEHLNIYTSSYSHDLEAYFFISFPSASGRTRDEKKRSKPARRCKGQARQAGKNQGCFRFSSHLLIF